MPVFVNQVFVVSMLDWISGDERGKGGLIMKQFDFLPEEISSVHSPNIFKSACQRVTRISFIEKSVRISACSKNWSVLVQLRLILINWLLGTDLEPRFIMATISWNIGIPIGVFKVSGGGKLIVGFSNSQIQKIDTGLASIKV